MYNETVKTASKANRNINPTEEVFDVKLTV